MWAFAEHRCHDAACCSCAVARLSRRFFGALRWGVLKGSLGPLGGLLRVSVSFLAVSFRGSSKARRWPRGCFGRDDSAEIPRRGLDGIVWELSRRALGPPWNPRGAAAGRARADPGLSWGYPGPREGPPGAPDGNAGYPHWTSILGPPVAGRRATTGPAGRCFFPSA